MMLKPALPLTCLILLFSLSAKAQKGKDGAGNYTSGVKILNRYTTPFASIHAGDTKFSVTNIADLFGSTSFTNSVNPFHSDSVQYGDLLLLIQVQGADIDTSDTGAYGTVTALNNTGNYELVQVFSVSGNQIKLCYGTVNSYTQSGRSRTQVIRVPRLTTLIVNPTATVKGESWGGVTGGIVCIETQGALTVNGAVSADTLGFRGGTDIILTSNPNLTASVNFYRRQLKDSSAGKGESIAGDSTDYGGLGGADGRGAPANGGGGGNGHNAGGGGGSNAAFNNAVAPYNGSGIKDTSGSWVTAWNREKPNFGLDSSLGGGRGGYSYGAIDTNALTEGPGLAVWLGDARHNVGGWGGHPLDYSSNNVLFMGGGGGSGEGNNGQWGVGSRGGGIVILLCNGNVSGTGSISARGQVGHSTPSLVYGNDAAGGGGGGGAINILASGTISGVSVHADGGKGGNQTINSVESEGPGGGGGGGYIGLTTNSVTQSVNGGANGITTSFAVTEFTANGATKGAPGTTASIPFIDYAPACSSSLPILLTSFSAVTIGEMISLKWTTANGINFDHFVIERSNNGNDNWTSLSEVRGSEYAGSNHYTFDDKTPLRGNDYYRLMMVDIDGQFNYSDIVTIINTDEQLVRIYPNPVEGNQLHIDSKYPVTGLQITNSVGQIVVSKRDLGNNITLSLPPMAPGFFQVKIITNRKTITTKLVKTSY